jgi:RNA polymerase sigma-70 factor (ECF subfamily)
MSAEEDLALVRRAQDGELEAYNRLVLTYQELAYNLAYRILSDSAAAEDATQNAFIGAYRALTSFRGGAFRSWLLRIVTNTCYDELRRLKRHPTTPLEPADDEGQEDIESPSWIADPGAGPEIVIEQAELDEAVQKCLKSLPDDFRIVVVMVDIEGLDYSEVSQAIRKPLGTIKSRLARARTKLRECLQGFWELLPVKFRLEIEDHS